MSATFIIRSANSALLALMFTALVACNSGADAVKYDPFSLIPQPVTLEPGDGEFLLSTMTGIVIDPALAMLQKLPLCSMGSLRALWNYNGYGTTGTGSSHCHHCNT
jgi:hypothetical protein